MTSVAATILIVDDELQNRKLLEALLQPEGYLTVCAASGAEALRLVAAGAPDLILLDIMMPGLSGYDVCTRLRADPATALHGHRPLTGPPIKPPCGMERPPDPARSAPARPA